jgi:hypothetical protein
VDQNGAYFHYATTLSSQQEFPSAIVAATEGIIYTISSRIFTVVTEQFTNLITVVGVTLLLTVLWAGSVVFAIWDIRRRNLSGVKSFAWLMLVLLVPIVGLVIYLFFRVLAYFISRWARREPPAGKRETALKQQPERRKPMPTIVAAGLVEETRTDLNVGPNSGVSRQEILLRYQFAIDAGLDQGKEFTIDSLPALIGRGSEAAVRLDRDLGVSRRHAEIYERNGQLRIRDLKSAHGTSVNGLRVEDQLLNTGDRIQVGTTVLSLKVIEG